MSTEAESPLSTFGRWFARKSEHAEALSGLREQIESRLADLVLEAEGLSGPEASRIGQDLDRARESIHEALRQAEREPTRLNLARAEQLESDLGVLHSRILQVKQPSPR